MSPTFLPKHVSVRKTITNEDVEKFAALSGDRNALHLNEEFAGKTRFGKRVVHGMLLASFFSQIVGMHIGTQKVLYLSQTLNFKEPVYIGETVQVEFELKHFSEAAQIATFKTTIKKESTGTICVDGEAKVAFI